MVFNIETENFRWKAWLFVGGHMTAAAETVTQASLVSRETVIIALMIDACNNVNVKSGDILNMCVQVPLTEKVWTMLGPKFGKDTRTQ